MKERISSGAGARLGARAARAAYACAIAACSAALLTACGGGGGGNVPAVAVAGTSTTAGAQTESARPVEPDARPKPVCTVQLWGDSILAGYSATTHRLATTPADLLEASGWTVDDRSADGSRAELRLSEMLPDPMTSRFVVLQFGINDATEGTTYEAPMRTMLERVAAAGRQAVITGLSRTRVPLANAQAYDATAERLAREYSVTFAAWRDVEYDVADMADDVHPAQAYSLRLARQLDRTLKHLAPECQPAVAADLERPTGIEGR